MKKPPQGPSALLASPGYGGTLAAVRCLGRHGFMVNVLSSTHSRPSAAIWSRYACRSFIAPPENDHERFIERLLAIGALEPGQVLLATSDETAWVYTKYQRELGRYFRLCQPPLETMRCILDKKLLGEAAMKAGIVTLPSWEPKSLADVKALAPALPYPILIKRRTHVHESINHKGIVVLSPEVLAQEYSRYLNKHTQGTGLLSSHENSAMPFLQQFASVKSDGVCSITGFLDRTGELFVTRRSAKIYQRSEPVGVGVCFESRIDDAELSRAVRRLCLEIGYFGIFEVEFIRFNDAWALIDFNPRLFNQLSLDIRRGMPLPLLACLDTLGHQEALREAVASARSDPEHGRGVFCDRFTFRAILAARSLTQRITKSDAQYWQEWLAKNSAYTADVARDPDDPLPGLIHALSEVSLGLRAIPKFLRLTPRTAGGSKRVGWISDCE